MTLMIMIVMIVFTKKIVHCLMFECWVEEKGDEGMRQRRERTSVEAEKPWWDEDVDNMSSTFLEMEDLSPYLPNLESF